MILTIDIGNTNITCGVFDGDKLTKKFRLTSDRDMDVKGYMELFVSEIGDIRLDGAIIGSVVEELTSRIQYAVLSKYGVKAHILTSESKLTIGFEGCDASSVGADRIANAVRGYEICKKAVIVVDFGTATTFDIVNSKGMFVGGIIAPGVDTQLKSLSDSASKLPEIAPDKAKSVIGHNTKDAILSGVVRGTAGMVDYMIKKTSEELGEPVNLIATGGYCELISLYTETKFDNISSDITLEGLNTLFPANKPNQPVWGR